MSFSKMKIVAIPLSSSLTIPKIIEISRKNQINVFNLDSIKNTFHIKLAFFHADSAFKEKRNISNSRLMEVMVRAAATKQIKEAIVKVGIINSKRIIVAYDVNKIKLNEKQIKSMFKAKKIVWKQSDSKNEIWKMVQAELEE